MTSSSPVQVPAVLEIPELGPALGRIALSAGTGVPPSVQSLLEPVRLDLTTAIFDLAADARSWSSAGDRQAAVDALARPAWVAAWEAAVRDAGARIAAEVDARIQSAAGESRIPRRKLRKALLSDGEKRAIVARLGRGGVTFMDGLAPLDRESQRVREAGVRDRDALERWRDSLTEAARGLESAWLSLEEATAEEAQRWSPLVESVRAWRRSWWLLMLISLATLAALLYVGLVIGGYLQGPPFLNAVAEWWWDWWDRLVEPA
jgi:hypothetical protein